MRKLFEKLIKLRIETHNFNKAQAILVTGSNIFKQILQFQMKYLNTYKLKKEWCIYRQ